MVDLNKCNKNIWILSILITLNTLDTQIKFDITFFV